MGELRLSWPVQFLNPINPSNLRRFLDINFLFPSNCKWKNDDYVKLLTEAATTLTYAETISSNLFPNADSLNLKIKEQTEIWSLHENFRDLTKPQLKKLKKQKVVLIFDETYEPFYGHTYNPWIHGYMPKKGCTGSFKFLVASILIGEKRYFVDCIMMNVFSKLEDKVDKMLGYLKKILNIEVILMDRGYRSVEIMKNVEKHDLKYILLYPKNAKIKKIISEESYKKVKHTINIGKKNEWTTTLVIVEDKKLKWTFVTNYNKRDLFNYIKIYRKRWNIETGFRVEDEARIKTKTTNSLVRYFIFIVGLVLYNIWKDYSVGVSFKRSLYNLHMNNLFQKFMKLANKEKYLKFIPDT